MTHTANDKGCKMKGKSKKSNFLKSGFEFLGRIRSRYFAIAYIAVIFVFAGIYSLLPSNSFYHTTVKYEDSLDNDAEIVLNQIRDIIINNIGSYDDDYIYISDNILIDRKYFFVHTMEFDENNNVSFIIDLEIFLNDSAHTQIFKKQHFSISLSDKIGTYDERLQEMIFHLIITPEEMGNLVDVPMEKICKAMFPKPEGISNNPYAYLIEIPSSLLNKIISIKNATNGFPSNVSNNFWRMFYLSSITITTVGYGDILPITDFARFVVAIEAISGILISGLFLNSLAFKIKSNKSSKRYERL